MLHYKKNCQLNFKNTSFIFYFAFIDFLFIFIYFLAQQYILLFNISIIKSCDYYQQFRTDHQAQTGC